MLNSKTEALGIIFPNSYDAMVPEAGFGASSWHPFHLPADTACAIYSFQHGT